MLSLFLKNVPALPFYREAFLTLVMALLLPELL